MGFLPPYFLGFLVAVLVVLFFKFIARHVASVDPDAGLRTIELIRRWGYPAENHEVVTKDGYVLELHRIPHGRNESRSSQSARPPILLMHGLHGSSLNWIINLPEQSAGFILAEAGFDVWLGNCRGNMFGLNHLWLDSDGREFWDFSWQEMADFDLPAIIDKVLNVTGQPSLHYMGHSQGFAIAAAHLASDEAFAHKINEVFGVAPVWSNGHAWGPAVWMTYQKPFYELSYRLFGSKAYHAKGSYVSTAAKYMCVQPGLNYACGFLLECFGGMPTLQINYTRTSVYMATCPAGSSTKNMLHWAQICHRQENRRYDYGERGNKERYGQASPPVYDLSNIRTPFHLFWSLEDWLANDRDIRENFLAKVDPGIIKSAEIIPGFNHFDFIFGTEAGERIFKHIIQRITLGRLVSHDQEILGDDFAQLLFPQCERSFNTTSSLSSCHCSPSNRFEHTVLQTSTVAC